MTLCHLHEGIYSCCTQSRLISKKTQWSLTTAEEWAYLPPVLCYKILFSRSRSHFGTVFFQKVFWEDFSLHIFLIKLIALATAIFGELRFVAILLILSYSEIHLSSCLYFSKSIFLSINITMFIRVLVVKCETAKCITFWKVKSNQKRAESIDLW